MATVYEKDGEYRVAARVRDEVRLEWDGWKRSDKSLEDLEADGVDAPSGPYASRTPSTPQMAVNQARAEVGEAKEAEAAKESEKDEEAKAEKSAKAKA